MYEKVNPSHPDKVADRIAGAIVDLCYKTSKNPKVACEVLIGHGEANIQVETSENITADDIHSIVSRIVENDIVTKALIVPQDKHLANNQQGAIRCGDNGIFKGIPTTHEQRLLTHIAAEIYDTWPHDGKYIIKGSGKLIRPKYHLTICQSNMDDCEEFNLCEEIKHSYKPEGNFDIVINPLGSWTGGPNVDSGATNRKLGSDMGDAVTGGGLCGKDLSKADVSVNIVCHLLAQSNLCSVTAMCSIGDEDVTFYIDGIEETLPYKDVVNIARTYIEDCGGFEKFSEWGLIRPE